MRGSYKSQQISLKYDDQDDTKKTLNWTADDAVESPTWTIVEYDNIIALTSSGVLLYTKQHGEGKDASCELDKVTITDPSDSLVRDFTIPSTSVLFNSALLEVVVSVGSGTRKGSKFYKDALQPLLELFDVQHTLRETTSESYISDLTVNTILPAANGGREQVIVLLSGDGGLVDVLNALNTAAHSEQYQQPTVCLIPTGTGNALANSIGVLNDKTHGLRTLVRGIGHGLPAFTATFSSGARMVTDEGRGESQLHNVNGQPTAQGCVVCSWALHAAIVADSDTHEYRKHGADRFKMAAKEALFPTDGSPPHAYEGKISFVSADAPESGWQSVDRLAHGYVLSTPVSQLEAGFTISPASRPFDGVLRLVHFGPLGGEEAMGIMGKAYQKGAHIEDSRVDYIAVKALRIDFNETDAQWRRVCVDGTIIKVERGGWVQVVMDSRSIISVVAI